MKIVKTVLFVVVICVILLVSAVCIPLQRQFNENYQFTVYSLATDEVISEGEAHVFGSYKSYFLGINSKCRFEGEIGIVLEQSTGIYYENAVVDIKNGIGSLYNLDKSNNMHLIGSFDKTRKPCDTGKIILAQPNNDSYVLYEKMK